VKDEEELRQVHRKLLERGLEHVPIHEPDPPYYGQLTAIGIPPLRDRKRIKPVLSRLRLLT